MDGLAISWLFRCMFFAFIAGAWAYGMRNDHGHWTRWYGFAAASYLAVVPMWQIIEAPHAPPITFSTPLMWAIGAAWGAAGALMLIAFKAIRDSCLDTGTREQLRAITNGEDEGINAA